MNAKTRPEAQTPLQIARRLAADFAENAAERDVAGGTPKAERDALRRSGLLSLIIPREYGGLGASWSETLQTVRELARVDSSIAHVYGFQHLMLATVRLFSRPEQWQPWFELTARNRWFWGNALNPLDNRTVARRFDGWREFSGKKSFCSGARDSEMLIASALDGEGGALLIAAIPTARSGISLGQDWDNMGQRQTDSGSAIFERVRVEESELLLDPGPLSTPFACLRPLIAQLIFTEVFLGIAEGAFEEARQYTLREARPWFRSEVAEANADPYVLARYGEFWVGLESTRALVERAAQRLDAAWSKGPALDASERGQLALAIAAAKVAATRNGLDLCNRMFEVTGARSTHAALRLDRYWRNLRTQTLHDPLDYKIRELGDWALNQSPPQPTFYHERFYPYSRPAADAATFAEPGDLDPRHRPGLRGSEVPGPARTPAPGGAERGQRAGDRRDRHRQGTGGAAYPQPQRAAQRPVRGGQLRGLLRVTGGSRAVRPREGRLHRRAPAQGRTDRGGRRRHSVP